MPNVQIRTNRLISKEKELAIKEQLGKAITCLDGKSEKWLMIEFSSEQEMWFRGTDEPCAYICVNIYEKGSAGSYQEFTKSVTAFIAQELKINRDRIYVGYYETEHWGWNGANF